MTIAMLLANTATAAERQSVFSEKSVDARLRP